MLQSLIFKKQRFKIHEAKTDRPKNIQYVENFKTPFSVTENEK